MTPTRRRRPPPHGWSRAGRPSPRLRIGYTMRPAWNDGLAPDVAAALRTTLTLLDSFGHAVEEHDMGVDLQAVWSTYNRLNAVETAADFDRLARRFGRTVRQDEVAPVNWSLIERGREMSATGLRRRWRPCVRQATRSPPTWTPTMCSSPRRSPRRRGRSATGRWKNPTSTPISTAGRTPATCSASTCRGFRRSPCRSLETADGVPIGVQLVARHGDEATLLRLAQQMQDELRWQDRRPPSTAP